MMMNKKISLDYTKLYGFKLLTSERQASVGAKVGDKVDSKTVPPVSGLLGSKIGGKVPDINFLPSLLSSKIGAKVLPGNK